MDAACPYLKFNTEVPEGIDVSLFGSSVRNIRLDCDFDKW